MGLSPDGLLQAARLRSGLTQRALAERAELTESEVAGIESGLLSPEWEILDRLVTAAGFKLECRIAPIISGRSYLLEDVARILRLSPADRLAEVANVSEFLAVAVRHV